MKFIFVVHRYRPYNGGSEVYTEAMATELVSRGHDVTVLAGEHQGDQNGVRVLSDLNELLTPCDLVIVHGGDVPYQDAVLRNAKQIPSPVLFMIIAPSPSETYKNAMQDCTYLSWSTEQDRLFLSEHGVLDKAVNIRHGIKDLESRASNHPFRARIGYSDDELLFLSCGGFWPNKKMKELDQVFREANVPKAKLLMTGYDNRYDIAPEKTETTMPIMVSDKQDVMDAINAADCYILHSTREGFGLVLLEAMINKTPWIARNIAGANLMQEFGQVYETDEELIELLRNFKRNEEQIEAAYEYAINNHLIKNTVDDIERILQ